MLLNKSTTETMQGMQGCRMWNHPIFPTIYAYTPDSDRPTLVWVGLSFARTGQGGALPLGYCSHYIWGRLELT